MCFGVASGGLGLQQLRVPVTAGEGATAAVPPVPVPEAERKLAPAVRVRQPAGGPELWTQHGDIRRAQEQLGNILNTHTQKKNARWNGIGKWLSRLCASAQNVVRLNTNTEG